MGAARRKEGKLQQSEYACSCLQIEIIVQKKIFFISRSFTALLCYFEQGQEK